MNRDNDIGTGTLIELQVGRDNDTMIITNSFFYSYQGGMVWQREEIVVSFRLVHENCELVFIEYQIPFYMLDPVTLGGCSLLCAGADKLAGWSLLLVGARKSGSWRFLPVGVGKQIECNIYIINMFFGFLPFLFPC